MQPDTSFYDRLAPLYHLIFQDWNETVRRQGEQFASVIEDNWRGSHRVLDVSCGIGTQALGLAQRGYSLVASDLSPEAIARAEREAKARQLAVPFSIADMRHASEHHGDGFDVVICADNSLPHLLTDEDIHAALRQMHNCLRSGGGCIITVRDYDAEPRGTGIIKPYGVRVVDHRRFVIFQVWDFNGVICNITFFFVEEDLRTREVCTHAMRSTYYAVSTSTLMDFMQNAGFGSVRRLDGVFYQPVLVGTRVT
jgi:SAM-dependent methyltransferase